MVKQHYCLSGHEFEHIPGDNRGQRSLAYCQLFGCKRGYNLVTEQQQKYRDLRCGKNQRSIGFVPWVVGSTDTEIPTTCLLLRTLLES